MKVLCCRFCNNYVEAKDFSSEVCDNVNLRLGIGVCKLKQDIDPNTRCISHKDFQNMNSESIMWSDAEPCDKAEPRNKMWIDGEFKVINLE